MTKRAPLKKAAPKSASVNVRVPKGMRSLVAASNPYAVSLENALEIAQRAGILTATGKLARRFK